MKQISFATLAETGKKRKTRRERFLAEMERVVPWPALLTLIELTNLYLARRKLQT